MLPLPAAATLLDRALQQGWVSLPVLRQRLEAAPQRTGNVAIRQLLAAADPAAPAESERLLHRLLRQDGIVGWLAGFRLPDGRELDVASPRQRVGIEVDGWAWHSDPTRFQRDRNKQNDLVAQGWTVLRFTWLDLVQRPQRVLATVQAALAQAA